MTLKQLHQKIRHRLEGADIPSAVLDSRLLLQHALGLSHEAFIAANEDAVSEQNVKDVETLVCRRIAGEPVSRILGRREFWGMDFLLSPDTLDPRPDSETLIETVLKHLPDKKAPLKFLDLGTGTGCLLLALLSECPNAKGVGIDLAEGAIEVARKNAGTLGFKNRARFAVQSWAADISGAPFDVVISNPPYIETSDIAGLQPEVKNHDPLLALDGGADGLFCYREIIACLPKWLTPGGVCVFEIGHTQATAVSDLLEALEFKVSGVFRDYGGRDRCIAAHFGGLR